MLFLIFFGILLIAIAVFESFYAGEKYFRWILRQYGRDIDKFNIKRVRIVRGICLAICGLTLICIDWFGEGLFWMPAIIVALAVVTQFIAISNFCKK